MKTFITKNAAETKKIAVRVAKHLKAAPPQKHALVLALSGNLGAGKTTFLQGLAKGLGVKEVPKSPTFILMQIFETRIRNKELGIRNLIHIDAYRIENPKELLHLGIKEIFKDKNSIIVIEWAEKVKKLLPKNTLWIYFEHKGKNKRKITIQ